MTGSGTLLGSLNITCDNVTATATPLALGSPQSVHVEKLGINSCETSGNDACVVIGYELPLANLNKTGLDAGTVTLTNGLTFVLCQDVLGPFDVECEYDGTGLEFTIGAQHLTADDTPLGDHEIGPDFLCPDSPTLDGLLTTTSNRYVLA